MSIYAINGGELKDMISVAADYLEKNKKAIDSMNVFPVPDGDTGINMSLTLRMANREVRGTHCTTIPEVANAISMGSLKGARGNSGVILSQIFRGFHKGLENVEGEMDGVDLARAMRQGTEAAYKAVMKPKEGTVLTVVRAMADAAEEITRNETGILRVIDHMIVAGEETLKKTPDMLPVLKEAGVVDAGGAGLILIVKGFKMALEGVEVPEEEMEIVSPGIAMAEDLDQDIAFAYCTEFFIKQPGGGITEGDADRLKAQFEKLGDCVLVVGGGDLLKVHVHTNHPGRILQFGLTLGYLSQIKIDNMREQNVAFSAVPSWQEDVPQKEFAMVTVAAGEGFRQVFLDLGVDVVVSGGQSMNPSIEDLVRAVDQAPAETVFLFPNNKNIVLAAEQAAEASEKRVIVVPTLSIPQGISGALAFNPEWKAEENQKTMESAIKEVDCGQITHAVRNSTMNGLSVDEGDVIGIFNGDMIVSGEDVGKTSLDLLGKMVNGDREVISIFYGEMVQEKEAGILGEEVEERFPDCEVQVYPGLQPVYEYIFSVE